MLEIEVQEDYNSVVELFDIVERVIDYLLRQDNLIANSVQVDSGYTKPLHTEDPNARYENWGADGQFQAVLNATVISGQWSADLMAEPDKNGEEGIVVSVSVQEMETMPKQDVLVVKGVTYRKAEQMHKQALYYHHCTTLMECLMQEAESDVVEGEGQEIRGSKERTSELVTSVAQEKGIELSPEAIENVAERLQANWSDYASSAFEDVHDELWKILETKKDEWIQNWSRATEQYLTGRDDLSEDQKENAFDLIVDEEDGAFLAIWEEAGAGIGTWECEGGHWAELCEMDIAGEDILALMPSKFGLLERVYDESYLLTETAILRAIEEYEELG